jgi:hypothetical protein
VIRDLPYVPLLFETAAIVIRPDVVRGLSAIDADWPAHVDTAWLWSNKG